MVDEVQRPSTRVIDEVDSTRPDEARTPLIISGQNDQLESTTCKQPK